jgi:hypothetical protein
MSVLICLTVAIVLLCICVFHLSSVIKDLSSKILLLENYTTGMISRIMDITRNEEKILEELEEIRDQKIIDTKLASLTK